MTLLQGRYLPYEAINYVLSLEMCLLHLSCHLSRSEGVPELQFYPGPHQSDKQ